MSTNSLFTSRPGHLLLALLASVALSGCDVLGVETPGKVAQKKEAEGQAIGGACRHAVRSLEDCYASNPKASKAAIFAGWREMDQYMRENEIPGMPSQLSGAQTSAAAVTKPPVEEVINSVPAAAPTNPAPTGAINLPPRPNVVPGR